jgi:hypothetical protein
MIILLCAAIAGVGLFGYAEQSAVPELTMGAVILAGVCGGISLFVPGKVGVILQVIAHAASVGVYALYESNAANRVARLQINDLLGLLLVVNLMLLAYGLLRLCDYAGSTRRRKLMEQLGIEVPPEDNDPRHPDDRWEQWDDSEDRKRR